MSIAPATTLLHKSDSQLRRLAALARERETSRDEPQEHSAIDAFVLALDVLLVVQKTAKTSLLTFDPIRAIQHFVVHHSLFLLCNTVNPLIVDQKGRDRLEAAPTGEILPEMVGKDKHEWNHWLSQEQMVSQTGLEA